MIDNVIWDIRNIEVEHEMCEVYPRVTAELRLEHDPYRPYPNWHHCGQLMDDLRERLGTQPKIQTSSLYGYFKADAIGNALAFDRMVCTIEKVIFNNPATIIKWRDGTKTVVKCQNGEPFDPEKGFVMAYLKKLLGNDNTFNKEIAKWVKEDNYVQEKQ